MHGLAASILQQGLGALHIFEELGPRLMVGPVMGESVRRQLMTVFDNAPDKLRIALRDPTQREKGGGGAGFCEQLQDAVDVGLDPAFARVPVGAADMGKESFDLEVIFHVHRHGVRCPSWTARGRPLAPADDWIGFSRVLAHGVPRLRPAVS